MNTVLIDSMSSLVVCLAIVVWILEYLFYMRLQKHQHEVWQKLGRPTILPWSNKWRTLRFVMRREYRGLSDPHSVGLARLFGGGLIIIIALLFCMAILLVAS